MVLSLIIVDLIAPAFQRSVACQMVVVTRVEKVKSNNANLTVRADSTLSLTTKILRVVFAKSLRYSTVVSSLNYSIGA